MKKKCLQCRSVYEAVSLEKHPKGARPKNKYKHKCGWGECPFSLQQVEQDKHKCFIQPIDPDEDEPQLKKVKESEIGNHKAYVDQDGGLWVENSPPLFVYADYEAVTDDSGVQSPILVCCEGEDGHEPPPFYGTSCTEDFFDYFDNLTVDEYNDERHVIVIFHNFKGYDAMFVLQYLYANCREVRNQICIGTTVLSLVILHLKILSVSYLFLLLLSLPPLTLKNTRKASSPIYSILWRIKVMRDLPLIHASTTLTGSPRTRKKNS